MYSLIRPLLFRFDAEKTHNFVLSTLRWLPIFQPSFSAKQISAMGLTFPHAVGLAAGLDKNGDYLQGLSKLGFSFIELGTTTPRPQLGNPKPRLFRLPKAQGIINRMGFNNKGVDALIANVKKANYSGILGINIGKNKDTPLEKAQEDYLYCLQKVYAHASYIVINISSPNTKDLRLLQQGEYFSALLDALMEEQKRLSDKQQRQVPLLVKISPDESDDTLKQIADTVIAKGLAGIIATNTTCFKEEVSHWIHGQEEGGLSGRPLFQRSTHSLRILKQAIGNEVTLIGVGGIDSLNSAQEKLNAGADLLQVYSGLIYKGPALIPELVNGLQTSEKNSISLLDA